MFVFQGCRCCHATFVDASVYACQVVIYGRDGAVDSLRRSVVSHGVQSS